MIPRVTITIDPGGNSGGGGGGNQPPTPAAFALYADDGSIPDTAGTLTGWGIASIVAGTPKAAVDTVTGATIAQFFVGSTVAIPAAVADFTSAEETEVFFIWRGRQWNPGGVRAVMSSTAGNSVAGYQIAIADDNSNNGRYRKIQARIFNGSSFIVDEPPTSGFYNNNFIDGKWVLSSVKISSSEVMATVDGEQAYSFAPSFAFPGGGSNFVIGGANVDFRCIVMTRGGLTTPERASWIAYLANRFQISLLSQVVGSPTTELYYAFPGATVLPTSIATCYRAGLFHSGDVGVIDAKFSSNRGATWTVPTTIQSDNTFDSRDPCFSPRLLNGDYILNYFLQTIGGANGHETSWMRRSPDNLATFGSPIQVTAGVVMGTTGFEACSAPVVQRANGNLLFPLYGKNDGDTHTSVWAIIGNAAWSGSPTVVKVADGQVAGISYSEIGFLVIHTARDDLNVGDILCMIRDDTSGNSMWETVSTNGGLNWRTLVSVPGLHSSARGMIQTASGMIMGVWRPNDPAAAVSVRTGAATWETPQAAIALGVIDAATTYGTPVEVTPGLTTWVYGREHHAISPSIADIVARVDMPEGLFTTTIPMVITPTSASVTVSTQTQIITRGAPPFTYPFASQGSGSPSVSGSGVYTAGASNGVDVVNVTDVNGHITPVTFTVSGGTSVLPPTSIDAGNLTAWWDPTRGKTLDGSDNVSVWTSVDGSARALNGGAAPTPGTALNGKASLGFDGSTQVFNGPAFTVNTLLGAGSWTVGFAFIDTGSPADTGNYFTMAAIIGSVTDGVFALGTTATQVYAGQGDTGAGATYDIRAAAAATVHYAVVQYDAGAGKIFISIDGGSFDAGTTVAALGASSTSTEVGKSGVISAYFKGSLGNLATWKSKLAGADLAALKSFLASTI